MIAEEQTPGIAELLRRCGLFAGFDQTTLHQLIQAAEEISVDAGAIVFRELDPGDAMFVVVGGTLQVHTQREGRDIVLARVEPGGYFGEQALLPGGTGRRNAGVRAAEPSRLVRIPRESFQALLASDDAFREQLSAVGAEQLRQHLQNLSSLARGLGLENIGTLRRTVAKGEVLFRQGDEAEAMYFVSSGRLSIWRGEEGDRKLIGYTERAGCVGELGLIRNEKRSATVIAEEPTELLAVPAAAFTRAYQQSQEVQEHLSTLLRAYELPQRGLLTQHEGTFAGQPCITTLHHLHDGSVVAAYRVLGQALFAVERLGAETADTLSWQDGGQTRELRLDTEGALVGLTASGDWPGVHSFHVLVLDRARIRPDQQWEFLNRGTFPLSEPPAEAGLVCHCVHVTADRLRAAIQNGAKSFTKLREITGCGTVCGGCVPVVAEMLGGEGWVLADVVSEKDEAPGIRSFNIVPRDSAYPQAAPGQHIVVEGLVGGLRLRRPYTLSSPPGHGGALRITVKREEGGAFSPWLFDGRRKTEPLRITRPHGEYIIDLGKDFAVCMVAGIGVTPAVAAAAAARNGSTGRVFVHYSGRRRNQMALLPELEEAAAEGRIELRVRETATEGRLTLSEISELAARFPNAQWYVCGPDSYIVEVRRMLRAAGLPEKRIHSETFAAVGAPLVTDTDRAALAHYMLTPPRPTPVRRSVKILRQAGSAVSALANSPSTDWRAGQVQLNPLRWIEKRLAGAAGVDPALPLQFATVISMHADGPSGYQLRAFERLDPSAAANRESGKQGLLRDKPLPTNTPDGGTFSYWLPRMPLPRIPSNCAVDTGWTKTGEGRLLPVYVTRSRVALEHLLRTSDYADRGPVPYHHIQQFLGQLGTLPSPKHKAASLIASQINDNLTWQEDHTLAVDMFGFTALDPLGPGMSAAIDETCTLIDDLVDQEPGAVIDLNVLISKMAYAIVVRAMFGSVDPADMHEIGRTLTDGTRVLLKYVWGFVMGKLKAPADYPVQLMNARVAVRALIDKIRQADSEGKLTPAQRSLPIVQRILEATDAPDGGYERLFALVFPLVIAGHETTGHTVTWALYELSRNRDLEAAVLEEIETFRNAHGGSPVTTADYDERPLSLAVLAECLRRYPAIPTVARTTAAEGAVPPDPETGIGGFRYPANTTIFCSLIGVHHDPARWPEPYAFRPDRWMGEIQESMSLKEKGRTVRTTIRSREQAIDWLPFSAGPASCVGQHFNVFEYLHILDALLYRYRFEVLTPDREVSSTRTLIVGPEQGSIAVRILRRKRT